MASDSRVSDSEDAKKPDDSQQPKSALVRTTESQAKSSAGTDRARRPATRLPQPRRPGVGRVNE